MQPTEGRQSTTAQCPARTLPSRSESRLSLNFDHNFLKSHNNLKVRPLFWSKLQWVPACDAGNSALTLCYMWSCVGCEWRLLQTILCGENALSGQSEAFATGCLATPLKDYRLNVLDITFTISERARMSLHFSMQQIIFVCSLFGRENNLHRYSWFTSVQ